MNSFDYIVLNDRLIVNNEEGVTAESKMLSRHFPGDRNITKAPSLFTLSPELDLSPGTIENKARLLTNQRNVLNGF